MWVKGIVVLVMVAIVYSLGSAIFQLIKSDGDKSNMVYALMWRVGLSIGLFLCLFIAFYFGLIQPHDMGGASLN